MDVPHACRYMYMFADSAAQRARGKGQRKVETVVTTELFFQYCGHKPQPTSVQYT